ncbi:flagellar biosynthesis protein FlhA [Sulfuriflexus sp.]|uniref:flagellar biosynthesis protein FlhA n=1 Tax=Sulfuriflexus sp. TaxID=2015443 RepID=UPI0028CBFC24|nr:flagellar biosynthesis protein FlhA [Sulfuriflexus sp.]MDT8403916.1 flagellar biosynthesis protein FlhA [Sulfuriflexus sp.]
MGGLLSASRSGIGALFMLLMMLAMMVIPLPTILLDILFTFNIALALVVLLSGIYTQRPVDFTAFPTILLIATLLRLGLNVASTRVVLLDGHTGSDAAGEVIYAFGDFVVGGNYTVGLVVFAILVIINFVVVTKGAGRISEVSARFTLDAMPGKQMAIDADLNAGLIDQDEARQRRSDIANEADFYGSMDGASKFVRGDAIAGILILFINIIGGLAIGMVQHDLPFSTAIEYYTLLTIGDGLVAQIPSLVLSTAAAIIVTRSSGKHNMGENIFSELFSNPRALFVTAGIIGIMGMIPGMPNLAFLTLAAICGGAGWMITQRQQVAAQHKAAEAVAEAQAEPEHLSENKELSWDDVVPVDVIGLDVGYKLIPLVDKKQGGQLLSRIKGVRKKLTQELGFLIPSVHIRDKLDLEPGRYSISLMGVPVGEAEIYPEREMAINPGQVFGVIDGLTTKDPAFGLDALWIDPAQRDEAQTMGYTVVDASTVIATHLSQILHNHAHELLGREDVQQLLENLGKTAPKLVEGLVPETLSVGVVQKVLQNLLEERVPIRDMRTIVETLAVSGAQSQDAAALTAQVRVALGRSIVQYINGMESELAVITLDPTLEQMLQESLLSATDAGAGLEPGLADRLLKSLQDAARQQETAGKTPVLVVSPGIRLLMARFVRYAIPELHVLAFSEIPDTKQIRIVASVGRE